MAKSEWNAAIEQAIARSSAEFFQRLVEALAERGVASTRSAIAELLDLRPATLAAWASGKATPAVDRIVYLALSDRRGGWAAATGRAATGPRPR